MTFFVVSLVPLEVCHMTAALSSIYTYHGLLKSSRCEHKFPACIQAAEFVFQLARTETKYESLQVSVSLRPFVSIVVVI